MITTLDDKPKTTEEADSALQRGDVSEQPAPRRFYTVEEPHDLIRDYCLVGENTELVIERGLAEAEWYQCPVPKQTMRELLQRRDWPGIRDSIIWFGAMIVLGYLGYLWWGTWWAIIPFAIYGAMYGSSSDSRWHEASHGTAFKTDWLNNVLYEIASFMVMRNSALWRWSHTRHHSDTIIVGRDPEISVPRPADLVGLTLGMLGIPSAITYFKRMSRHVLGRLSDEEKDYIPQSDWKKVCWVSRFHALAYVLSIAAAVYFWSFLPLMYFVLPHFYGAWLMPLYGLTQHAGLAENVLDHRLNCRTVKMNIVNRFLYWNMNYHIEHHMFPLVPYHNLPRLHELIKDDCPEPYTSIYDAFSEIIPAVIRQAKDPGYYVKRKLPESLHAAHPGETPSSVRSFRSDGHDTTDGWYTVCTSDQLDLEDVVSFDHGSQTFAVYRTADGKCYATDGMCTHGRIHLASGFVKGNLIECSKHNGRFDVRDGSTQRPPVCVGLRTYPVREENDVVQIDLGHVGGAGAALAEQTHTFQVVSNQNVATYIKELVLEPTDGTSINYSPGDYLQLDIPAYESIKFSDFQVPEPYHTIWQANHVYDYETHNESAVRRNYSFASNPQADTHLRFNVRIASPPPGQDCYAGVGSSYVWNLKPGDTVTAIGPFGDFRIKDSLKEMIYVGGGAGMAPLRSHLSHLLDNMKTSRKISFWYGARSTQELFYTEYFDGLAEQLDNFSFHPALSEPQPEENWGGHTGFIHNVLFQNYLENHPDPTAAEYYLCGPPKMIEACTKMLEALGVPTDAIAFDEF